MNRILLIGLTLILTSCASLQTPRETNVAVSTLLDQLQVAINKISIKTKGSALPPFQRAEITLSTKAQINTAGEAKLVVSGEAGKSTANSNIITLELVPNKSPKRLFFEKGVGDRIADYVVAAVSAVDNKNFLKLHSLTVEAGLQVKETRAGGFEVELVGVSLKGKRSSEATSGNSIKLFFVHKEK